MLLTWATSTLDFPISQLFPQFSGTQLMNTIAPYGGTTLEQGDSPASPGPRAQKGSPFPPLLSKGSDPPTLTSSLKPLPPPNLDCDGDAFGPSP